MKTCFWRTFATMPPHPPSGHPSQEGTRRSAEHKNGPLLRRGGPLRDRVGRFDRAHGLTRHPHCPDSRRQGKHRRRRAHQGTMRIMPKGDEKRRLTCPQA